MTLPFSEMRVVLSILLFIAGLTQSCLAERDSGAARTSADSAINYADVRARVANSLPEKANEIADFIDTLQDISRATMEMTEKISANCGQ